MPDNPISNQAQTEPLSHLGIKTDLCPDIWADGSIKKSIGKSLAKIGSDFYGSLGLPYEIEDIVLTGSLANYNWSIYSDLDVHIMVDFPDNEKGTFAHMYAKSAARLWNSAHDIEISGHQVEVYVQNLSDKHVSTGMYSLERDEWITKPEPGEMKTPDYPTIIKKVKSYCSKIRELENDLEDGDPQETKQAADKLWERIAASRAAALEKHGETATENMIFKTMRINGYLNRLWVLRNRASDNIYSRADTDNETK